MLVKRRGLKWRLWWGLGVLLYAALQVSTQQTESPQATQATATAAATATATATATTPAEHHPPHEEKGKEEEEDDSVVPTWRPKRSNCTPPAIEQFPNPLIGPSARRHGALIIHLFVCIYSFIGLAIICDEYFVTSLDRICEELKLSPDVAGATFMAAGSSAPELATVIIGVFFAKDDIGISGVIGSAVFNIMFVIAVCALFGGTVSHLNWWPLCRDSTYYAISIVIMLAVIFDGKISWMESLFMIITYGLYFVVLANNKALEKWANTLPLPCKKVQENEDQHLVSYKNLEGATAPQLPQGGYTGGVEGGGGFEGGYQGPPAYNGQGFTEEPLTDVPPASQQQPAPGQKLQNQPEYYRTSQTQQSAPLERPETDNKVVLAQWYLSYPIHFLALRTMPDARTDKYKNWYPFTFAISMIWISFYSYIMVWMITIIGTTLGIPDTVMGLTFVAAGVSVPDALSSLAVVKEGYGDMAVSNAVGSNIFDILICLGVPWFLQTALIKPGSHVNVYSKGLTYSTLSLLSTVIFLIGATHMNGWKLDKKYGVILMGWYIFFITFAALYEMNVFGYMNPPECASDY